MKYVFYLRISTKKQDLRTQEENCLKFIRQSDKSDFKYEIYTDEISTRKKLDKRTGIQGALKALQRGDVLVGMRVDRLARNLYETTCIVNQLELKQADILLVDQPGIKNKVLLGLYAGIAEEEVKMIRKRIKEKLSSKCSRNELISHKIPYGCQLDLKNLIPIKNRHNDQYTMKPGLLIPEPAEQEVLAHILRLSDEGKSLRQIPLILTELGYSNRVGKQFQHKSIHRILCRVERTKSLDQPQAAKAC